MERERVLRMPRMTKQPGYLAGQCLVAMPSMSDPRFSRSVVYLCAHSDEGAMGLVVNRAIEQITFPDLLEQLDIEPSVSCQRIQVHFGGPVESARGFVLHSADYVHDGTMVVDDGIALTATMDVLRAIAGGAGPRRSILALGYAGWGPGQLETEMLDNAWLTVPADEALLFDGDLDRKWDQAFGRLGVTAAMLSDAAGHA